MKKLITTAAICMLATGCTTAAQHQQAVNSYDEEQLTVAAVQRTVREGMSGAAGGAGQPEHHLYRREPQRGVGL